MDKKVYCLIMAGGEGKRFWPKGKKGLPKQFFAVDGKRSMVEITFKRMKKLVCEEKIFIVTNKKQSVLMKKEMSFLNQNSFILEPFGRNTAAAIGLAALYLQLKDPRAVMLVSPCDHFVRNNKKFSQAVNLAIKTAACNNLLVTIGIQPTYPNAEYGYIKIRKPQTNPSPKDKPAGQGGIVRGRQKIEDKKRDERDDIFRVERFTEKPDRKTAGGFLKNG
ncbi:MAG: sugar phosphate nucleotidyltransferase, partial [Candidatus Omnitrophota bacterium]|nr:sugar phosphate nucleotidyltransferase [Candidatus Omnitrophota bacterium]